MSNKVFYLVWNSRTWYTMNRHRREDAARAEAKRLSRLNQGDYFFVLRALVRIKSETPVFVDELCNDDNPGAGAPNDGPAFDNWR